MTEKWTIAQAREHFSLQKKASDGKTGSGNKAKAEIEMFLKKTGIVFKKELVFAKGRRFRFDFAAPSLMLGIEYEGLFSEKSGHTTVTGYTKNCEKYNLAQILGWKVLRYTALNYGQVVDDLQHFTSEVAQLQKFLAGH